MKITPDQIQSPSLLVQIYFSNTGDHAGMGCLQLAETIAQNFSLQRVKDIPFWQSSTMFVQVLNGVDMHDTALFRWGLNSNSSACRDWEALRQIAAAQLQPLVKKWRPFWGITLIYQAVFPGFKIDQPMDVSTLLDLTLPLGSKNNHHARVLAQGRIPGGKLWLTSISISGRELETANLYLALAGTTGEADQTNYFINQPDFSQMDLFTQKAYFEKREYNQKLKLPGFDKKMTDLRESTSEILNSKNSSIEDDSRKLDLLARNYDAILDDALWLDGLKVSLFQQKLNLDSMRKQEPNNAIWEFHARHVDFYAQELEIQSNQVKGLLESSGQAVAIADSRIEKVKEKQRLRFEKILAFFGVAFSVPQLLTYDTVNNILDYYGWKLISPYILLIQVVITLLVAWVAILVVNSLSRKVE